MASSHPPGNQESAGQRLGPMPCVLPDSGSRDGDDTRATATPIGHLEHEVVGGHERDRRVAALIPAGARAHAGSVSLAASGFSLDKSLDELERLVASLPPTAVDRQRVSAVRYLNDLSRALVAFLALVGGIRDRPGHGVVLLAGDDQERSSPGAARGEWLATICGRGLAAARSSRVRRLRVSR
jgi:hypothetical protein